MVNDFVLSVMTKLRLNNGHFGRFRREGIPTSRLYSCAITHIQAGSKGEKAVFFRHLLHIYIKVLTWSDPDSKPPWGGVNGLFPENSLHLSTVLTVIPVDKEWG